MWHFKGTFGTSSFFSGPLLALLKTGRPSFPPETKRIKWKNEVVETWIKPCSHINRRNKTKTYIFQKVPHWNEEESKSAQIPQKILRVCLFFGGGGFTSAAPAAPHTTQIPCSPQSTTVIFTLVVEPVAAALKPGSFVLLWTPWWRRRRVSNFLLRLESRRRFKTRVKLPQGFLQALQQEASSGRSAAAVRSLNAPRPSRSREDAEWNKSGGKK